MLTVTLHQEPHRHYKIDGSWNVGKKRIAGVTSVLGDQADFLSKWASGQSFIAAGRITGRSPQELAEQAYERGLGPDALRDAGGRRGDAAHLVFAALCRGEQPPMELVTDLTWPYVQGLEQAVSDLGLYDGESEVPVASVKHAYAGTMDYFDPAARTLWDVKTGAPDEKHVLQLAAYELARREMGMVPARNLRLLYPTCYGTYTTLDVKDLGGYAAARRSWLQTLALYRSRNARTRLIQNQRRIV